MVDEKFEAATAYSMAIKLSPTELEWRYEFAELLESMGHRTGAMQELFAILSMQPRHAVARACFNKLLGTGQPNRKEAGRPQVSTFPFESAETKCRYHGFEAFG